MFKNVHFKFVIFFILFGLLLPGNVIAQEKREVAYLTPQSGNELVLEKVSIEKIEKDGKVGTRVSFSGKGKSGITQAYSLTVNLENKTYKTSRISDEIIEKEFLEPTYSTQTKESNLSYNRMSALNIEVQPMATYNYSASVRLLTEDPVFWDICYTRNRLNWKTYDSGSYWFNDVTSSFVDVWAANPSPINTHWYVDTYGGSWSKDSTTDRITHSVHGYFHNYDFGDNDKRTDVYQSVDVYAEKFGDFNYNAFYDVYGEANALLHSRIFVNE